MFVIHSRVNTCILVERTRVVPMSFPHIKLAVANLFLMAIKWLTGDISQISLDVLDVA